jgi:hypothetical protein
MFQRSGSDGAGALRWRLFPSCRAAPWDHLSPWVKVKEIRQRCA